ncbi:MAG: DUF4157 domain-containing protein [Cyanobacteria bacterium P01_F01_bin.150]
MSHHPPVNGKSSPHVSAPGNKPLQRYGTHQKSTSDWEMDSDQSESGYPSAEAQIAHALQFGHSFSKTVQRQALQRQTEEAEPESNVLLQRQSASDGGEDDDETGTPGISRATNGDEDETPIQPKLNIGVLMRQQEIAQRVQEEKDELKHRIQPKLTIGRPGDKYEQEAVRAASPKENRTAAQVMAMPDSFVPDPYGLIPKPGLQRQQEEDEPIQREPLIRIQAFSQPSQVEDEEPVHTKPLIQMRAEPLAAPDNFETDLGKHRGGGSPLSDKTRSFMEPRFGADFSGVRIHEAPKEAGAIGAQAFTHGQDIYFNSGKYNPGSSGGKELLAHELTHTIQQTGGKIQPKSRQALAPVNEVQRLCSKCQKDEAIQARQQEQETDKESGFFDKYRDETHTALDVAGFIPGVGAIADLANAGLYAAEGDWGNAALSSVAAIPGFGDAVGLAGKGAKAASKVIPKAGKVLGGGNKAIAQGSKVVGQKVGNVGKSLDKVHQGFEHPVPKSILKGPAAVVGDKVADKVVKGKGTKAWLKKQAVKQATVQGLKHGVGGTFGEAGKTIAGGVKGEADRQKLDRVKGAVPDIAQNLLSPEDSSATGEATPEAHLQNAPEQSDPNLQTLNAGEVTGLSAPSSAQSEQSSGGTSPQQSSSGGGGAMPSGGVPEVQGGNVDEGAEAIAMQQRLSAVPAEQRSTEGPLLSPTEQSIARSALTESPLGPSGGGGGGGGGAAVQTPPTPAIPDVSKSDPTSALAGVSSLPPAQLKSALGGVSQAIAHSVTQEQETLTANPPTAQTPNGKEGSKAATAPTADTPTSVTPAPEGTEVPVEKPAPTPPVAPAPPVAIPTPHVQGSEDGTLSGGDAQQIASSVNQLPTQDMGAPSTSAGSPPQLNLTGNADPQKAQEQKAELNASAADIQSKGLEDALASMGESDIYPTLPQETLQGTSGGAVGGAAAVIEQSTAGLEAASVIAQEQHGAEIQGAIAQAQGEMATQQSDHAATVADERARSQQDIAQLQQETLQQQETERANAQAEVSTLRQDWQGEQDTELASAQTEASQLVTDGLAEIETEKGTAESKASEEIQKGEEQAEQERIKGEQQAAAEKHKGQQESSGVFGWMADKVKGFFEGIKNAIKAAFDAARKAIRAAIEKAKELATAAIEAGRKAIVGVIRRVGDALIAVGDRLLAKFPQIRDRYRSFIQDAVNRAEETVNTLAEGLKTGIQKSLDLLGQGLDAALGLLNQGLNAVVSGLSGTISGILQTAQSAAQAFGALQAIIPDIAANPGQWISNFGSGVQGGVQEDVLWPKMQSQTQGWFDGKVQQITGLAPEQVDDLEQGGFSWSAIGGMVWDNLVAAIPGILLGVLIEKLISMLNPAVGAVITIVQSLMAAWGTVSQVLVAFTMFVSFLQAVKMGSAAPLFAGLIASAAIIVLNFIAQWVIGKLKAAGKAIAGKLKGMAKGIRDKRNKKESPDTDSEDSLESSDSTQQKRDNADVERDKVAEEELPGGHKVKVTDDGDTYVCSVCKAADLTDDKREDIDKASSPQERARIVSEDMEKKGIGSSRKEEDMPSYRTPFSPLTSSQKQELEQKLSDRTLSKEEWDHLDWDRRFGNRRARGVSRFWSKERRNLKTGESGTRNWSLEQQEAILAGKTPKFDDISIEGHHKYSALSYPQLADNPDYIYPTTRNEHLKRWHGGDYQNSTHGSPLDPDFEEEF